MFGSYRFAYEIFLETLLSCIITELWSEIPGSSEIGVGHLDAFFFLNPPP